MIENLYIHVPFCNGKCAYCTFYSRSADAHLLSGYARLPAEELSALLDEGVVERSGLQLRTLYIGGGTPSLLGGEGIARMVEAISGLISLRNIEEFSVEINPADASRDLFNQLKSAGVTRISIGVQSFSDNVLRAIGRRHDAKGAITAIEYALEAGFFDTGIDLIAGLPQAVDDADKTVSVLKSLLPSLKHVSLYALTLEPGCRLHRQVESGAIVLPDEESCMDEIGTLAKAMADFGVRRYEVSNYAREGYACRHNLAVWRGADYLGLGPSAASRAGLRRWCNASEVECAGARQTRRIENVDALNDALERFFFRLRLREGFSLRRDFEEVATFAPFRERWIECFRQFADDGLLARTECGYAPTERGLDMCDFMLRELYPL